MVGEVLFKCEKEDWGTPQWLFDALDKEFGFTLDVCASDENAKCDRYYTIKDSGLLKDWKTNVCWCNPPYGPKQTGLWFHKAYAAAQAGATVVVLAPARTDTRWFHEYAMKGELRFLRGRLTFEGAPSTAPFPSLLSVFRPKEFRLVSYGPHDD